MNRIYFQYAYYSQYKTMASTIFPIFFSFYMGAWCDMFGRKLLMKIYLLSRIITKCGHISCAYFMYSSKWWILVTDIPSWISGMLPIYITILFIVIKLIFNNCSICPFRWISRGLKTNQ